MTPKTKSACTLSALLILMTAPLMSHDFWIAPWTFQPQIGTALAVELMVGDHFQGEALSRDPSLIEKFLWAAPQGDPQPVKSLSGRLGRLEYRRQGGARLPAGSDPAGFVVAQQTGLHVLGYQSRPSFTSMPSAHFRTHLLAESQSQALRIHDGRQKKPHIRESFIRCAKALLQAGEADSTAMDQPLGMPLELVTEINPYTLQSGQALALRLLYQGKPLAGVRVTARFRDDLFVEASDLSDGQGRVNLLLKRPGVWMVKALHTIEAADEDQGTDWVSYWASTTFELPANPPRH